MLASLFSSPTIKIALEEDQVFLHPISANYPTTDPVLRGTALVTLPSRRAIRRFKVTLEGLCDAYGGDNYPYESTVSLHKELNQDFHGEVFEAGNHAFNFSFIIPSSTAVSQRSMYGRIRYYVKAQFDFDGGLLTNSVSSPPVAFWVAANPSPPGELPTPTDLTFQHWSPDLGPVGISLTSPHLTQSALCNVRVALLGPPTAVDIVSVNATITQTFEVHYQDGEIARPKPRTFTLQKVDQGSSPSLVVAIHNPATCTVRPGLPATGSPASFPSSPPPSALPSGLPTEAPVEGFRPQSTCCPILPDKPVADPTPLAAVQAGHEFHFSRICRVPDDDCVRPTTLEGTETKIRVAHKMNVEIRYRKDGDSEDMVLSIGKPVTVTSCCCLVDSLFLPAYSASAPPKTITRPLQSRCACNMSLKECFDRDGAALQRAGTIDSPSSTPRLIGIDGCTVDPTLKSPSWTDGGGGLLPPPPLSKEMEARQDSGFGGESSGNRTNLETGGG
ncbi:hypothetical protein JCM10213_007249 [Rhodosporidiobolus nylandii]